MSGQTAHAVNVSGVPWPSGSFTVPLVRGLNLISYPGPVVPSSLSSSAALLGFTSSGVTVARIQPDAAGIPLLEVKLEGPGCASGELPILT